MTLKELFTDPTKWVKSSYGRTADQRSVGALHPEAVCWCLSGAVEKCYEDSLERAAAHQRLLTVIYEKSGYTTLTGWNDVPSRTFDEVREVIRLANV